MNYALIVKPSAAKDIERLPATVQRRVLQRLAQIQANPGLPGCAKLAGAPNTYRVRVGSWRIVYEIDDAQHIVYVTIVAHRREVYRGF